MPRVRCEHPRLKNKIGGGAAHARPGGFEGIYAARAEVMPSIAE